MALIAAALFIVIAGTAAFLIRSRRPHTPPLPDPAASVTLRAPRGEVKAVPESFEWEAVPGASDYKVTISDADAVWPMFVRTTASTSLQLDPKQASAIVPGRIHVWEVEACDARGTPIARGETRFRVAPASG
jgi:hypothetical protein